MVSQNGLSESVMREIATNLDSHELIKIRVFSAEREVREAYLAAICAQLAAAPVQHIGKLLVVWRPAPAAKTPKARRGHHEPRRTKRSFQGGTSD
jgi:RNA-binding protein YhbY